MRQIDVRRAKKWVVPIVRDKLKKFTKEPRGKYFYNYVILVKSVSKRYGSNYEHKIVLEREGKSFILNANDLLRDRLCSIFKVS